MSSYLQRNLIPLVVGLVAVVAIVIGTGSLVLWARGGPRDGRLDRDRTAGGTAEDYCCTAHRMTHLDPAEMVTVTPDATEIGPALMPLWPAAMV